MNQSSSLGSSIMSGAETVLEKSLSGACGKDGDRESDFVSKKLATHEGKKRRWRVSDPYDDYIGRDVEYESEEERDEVFYGRRLSAYDSMEWRRQRVREMKEDIRELATYKDGSDIARYIQNLESDLKDIGVAEAKYKRILLKKLSVKARHLVDDVLDEDECSYAELKAVLLRKVGLHTKEVYTKLFSTFEKDTRHQDHVSRYQYLKTLIDRFSLSCTSKRDMALKVAVGIFRSTLTQTEKCIFEGRTIEKFDDLCVMAESLKTEETPHHRERRGGRSDHFNSGGRAEQSGIGYNGRNLTTCYRCHKIGHRAVDCCVRLDSSSVVCFTCGQTGHKSNECSIKAGKQNGIKSDNKSSRPSDGKSKSGCAAVCVVSTAPIRGFVNNKACSMIPDTGADTSTSTSSTSTSKSRASTTTVFISVVPKSLLSEDCKMEETVHVRLASGVAEERPLAKVKIDVDDASCEQIVMVAHDDAPKETVFFSVPLSETESHELLLTAVETSGKTQGSTGQSGGTPDSQTSGLGADNLSEVGESKSEEQTAMVVTRAAEKKRRQAQELSDKVNSDGVVPISLDSLPSAITADGEVDRGVEGRVEEAVDRPSSNGVAEESSCESLGCPDLVEGDSRESLRCELRSDESLRFCRDLADGASLGYKWEDGLMYHTSLDPNDETVHRMVLPARVRIRVLKVCHEHYGHTSIKGMRTLLNRHFVWPGMSSDVASYVRSCNECLRHNKAGHRQSKMVERPVITVPFDMVAFDIVGPLEKAKGGVRYILTYICMVSRWPEAVALRTVTADSVASGIVEIVCRTGIPSKMLTDRGTVFTSRVCERVCEVLGVDKIHSSPYRPQTNGVLERLHGTLKPMLAKAREKGVDWSLFLPLALYAIRQIVHTSTGFSPHEIVFGRRVTGL